MKLNPKALYQEGEEEIIDSKDLEAHLLDKDQVVFDARTQALLDKLERDNFTRADKEMSPEERLLVEAEMGRVQGTNVDEYLAEMKEAGIPDEIIN